MLTSKGRQLLWQQPCESDEAGHAFQYEAGHLFRSKPAGVPIDVGHRRCFRGSK